MESPKSEICLPDSTPLSPRKIETGPSFYLTDLAKYVSGRLVGQWIYLENFNSFEELQVAFSSVLSTWGAEDWIIVAFDEIPNLGENPDLEKLWDVFEQVRQHGSDVVEAFCSVYSPEDISETSITDSYQGSYGSFNEFVETWAEETGLLSEVPESLRSYIDLRALGRDLRLDGSVLVAELNGKAYVFNSL